MRRLAVHVMHGWPKNGTLQPTALVHEACLKLFGSEAVGQCERTELLALACSAMRSVLVDHARARSTAKRQAPGERVELDRVSAAFEERACDILALHEALERLSVFDPVMGRAVELSFFGGLSFEETASNIGIPLRTFERRWAATRAWLRAEIG